MGLKKYKGPLHTVERVMMAHAVVTVTCQNCHHENLMFALAAQKNEMLFAKRNQRSNPRAKAEFDKLTAQLGAISNLLTY
jgi:hypothetical protein